IVWKLHPEALEFIEGVGEALSIPAGAAIVREGEESDAMYLILEGSVRVERAGQAVATLDKLRSFGEIAMLTGAPRTADVAAQTDVRVLRITRDNLNTLSQNNPRIALQIFRSLAESLARSLAAKS